MEWIQTPARRRFLQAAAAGGSLLVAQPSSAVEAASLAGPVEDLMREHGVLRRAMLAYRECARRLRLDARAPVAEPLHRTAKLIRRFGEDFHERAVEEKFIFPALLEEPAPLSRYPAILIAQHEAGRERTSYLLEVAARGQLPSGSIPPVLRAIDSFVRMYEHHTNREDTEVFHRWRQSVPPERFEYLDAQLQDVETRMIGPTGIEQAIAEVSDIERDLGIADLQQFTPR